MSRLNTVKQKWLTSEDVDCSLSYAQLEVWMDMEARDSFSEIPCFHRACSHCPFFKENLEHALDPETMAPDILARAQK